LKDEITKWQNFVSDCNGAIQERNNKMASQLEEARKQASENAQEQLKFCQKLRGLQEQGPGPGCNGDHSAKDLYSDAVEIASVLQAQQPQRGPASILNPGSNSTQIFEQINEYSRFCDEANSQGLLSDNGEDDSSNDQLITLCEDNGGDQELITNLTDTLIKGLTEDEKKYEDNLKDYILGEADLSEDLKKVLRKDNRTMARQIKSLQERSNEFKDSENGYGRGFCSMITSNSGKTAYISKECKKYEGDEDKTAFQKCESEARDRFSDDKLDALGLSSAAKVIASVNSPGLQDAWHSIGEKYNGTACAAINGSQLGQKGLIPGLMEKINRDIASEDGMIQ
ncbi:hypothetical protein, partial [Halobacteriovorax sp. Y22]|uniref:hypothetical protein n=1 Tax=Halobacteriovorax sp. Y22 TaxID=2505978 RepID=UPI0014369419